MKYINHIIGYTAEQVACDYLHQQGHCLLTQNFRTRFGEIDLITRWQDLIIFTEVRCHNHQQYGGSLASVTLTKQKKLQKTALIYLQQQFGTDQIPCRFDVITLENNQQKFVITNWIQQAF